MSGDKMGPLDQSSQRVMPDWMYDASPKLKGLLESLNNAVTTRRQESLTPSTNPMISQAGSVNYPSAADLMIGNTPLGNVPMMEGLLKNGLPQLPLTFQNAMGSDTGRAVSYGMAGLAGLGSLIPAMNRGGGAHPMLAPKAPTMAEFRAASPTAFGMQDPLLDAGPLNSGLPIFLQQQAF